MKRLTAFVLLLLSSCKQKAIEHPTAVAGRSYQVLLPEQVESAPVLVVLHAFSTSAQTQRGYFDADRVFLKQGYVVVLPTGTTDADGNTFWNATDGCCDQHGTKPDDVAYLDAVLDDVAARYPVDPKRVFLAGVSNGGFMAQRYACDRAQRVRGFASVSGALWEDLTRCVPAKPVAALLVHGDADPVVRIDGGVSLITGSSARYPSAQTAAQFWAGAAAPVVSSDTSTTTLKWPGDVQLWTFHGVGHAIPRSEGLPRRIDDFFAKLP